MGDSAHLGFHSGAGHHAGAVTRGDGAGGKHHIFPVAQGRCLRTAGRSVFLHGQGFPCEGGFLRFQVDRFQKPGVGWNEIPGLQQKNVSGHQILRGDFRRLGIADDSGMGGGQLFQGGDGLFRLALLDYTGDGVDDNDQ